jgi:nucleotide-binding universal stress UspA family protein
MRKNLVVWNHQGNNQSVLHKAADLLKAHDQKAVVVIFINDFHDEERLNTKHIASLEEQVHHILGADRVEECLIAKGNKAAWIIEYCREHDVELVIKPWRRNKQHFYTKSDWQLIRHLNSHLLLVRAGKWDGYHRILAAVDVFEPSEVQKAVNKLVMERASFWAETRNSQLDVVHCITMSKIAIELDMVEQIEVEKSHKPLREAQLDKLVEQYQVPIERRHVLAGRPEQVIDKVANSLGADLIVLGSQGKRAVGNLYLGDTATRILEHLSTDILIVRPMVDE